MKDSLLENTMWYGAPIRFDRPRSAIVHCTETLHKDAISTVLTAEIMKYEHNGQLKAFMTCSVLVPNLFLSGELEGCTATVSHAYFHEVEQRILRVDFEHGGVFARPTLTKPGSAIDLFAGFGGWAIGQDWATEATGRSNPHITVSIESNRSTAKNSAGLFGGVFWEKSDFLVDNLTNFGQGQHFIHSVVGEKKVHQKLSKWNFTVAVASPSCQPWSSASSQNGLSTDLGFNFCELIQYVCNMQPCLLALENVKGLQNHLHFPLLIQILEHNGLRLVHQEVQTSRKWLPTDRTRLLCLFKQRDWECRTVQINELHRLNIPNNVQLKKIDCYLDEDIRDERKLLAPNELELKNLANPEFLHGASTSPNPVQVLAARNVSNKGHFGPIMASYRSKCQLSGVILA